MTYAVSWVGGAHVFIPAFEPASTVSALADEHCTITLLVPTMLGMVLASGALDGADLTALRALMYGASPMPGEVQRRVAEGFGCELYQLYGMTEASPIATSMDGEDHRRGMAGEEPYASRLRSAGAPVPGVRCEVRREDGSLADVGEPGEIISKARTSWPDTGTGLKKPLTPSSMVGIAPVTSPGKTPMATSMSSIERKT